jgi:hypothetical protein
MDDDKEKSLVEKMVDKINDVVENIANTASDAARHAMEPQPVKPGEQVVFMPMAGDGFADPLMSPMPMMPVVIPKKKRKVPVKLAPAKIPPKNAAAKKMAKKAAKNTPKKSGKKTKSSAGRKAVGTEKTAKNAARKKKAKR